MVQRLFDLSSHAVRNAIVKGEIRNVSGLSSTLRCWIFEMLEMKQMLNHKNAVRVFKQAGFFDGFTTISIHETDCSDSFRSSVKSDMRCGHFLLSLVSIFRSNQHLAEKITDLSVRIANVYPERHCLMAKPHVLMDVIANLLQLCNNLKRLQLKTTLCKDYLRRGSVLQSYSETANVAFRQLEELELIGSEPLKKIDQFPKQWFRSVRSLKLYQIDCNSPAYVDALACCQDTLVSFNFSDETTNLDFIDSPVPICLPNLSSLTFESTRARPSIFRDIQNHCPNLKTATLTIPINTISETELISLSQLANRLRLYLSCKMMRNLSELVKVAGQSIFGLQTFCNSHSERDYEGVLSFCTNLRKLRMSSIGDAEMNFLQNLLEDKEKAMRLEELYFYDPLPPQILKLLFANCCNLRCLYLKSSSSPVDLSSALQLWVESGARPISLDLSSFEPLCPDTVCSLLKASGRQLQTIKLKVRWDDEDAHFKFSSILCNYCPYVGLCEIEFATYFGLHTTTFFMNQGERMCFNFCPVDIHGTCNKRLMATESSDY